MCVCVCVWGSKTHLVRWQPHPSHQTLPDLHTHTQLFYRLQHSRVTSTVVLLTNAMRMHIFACIKYIYTVQKFGVCKTFVEWMNEINTFIHQGCIKLIESYSKDMYTVTKVLNKCCSFELSIHQRILKNNASRFSTKIWSSMTVFNTDIIIRNVSLSRKSSY